MVKLVFSLRRLPQLSRDDFQRYWREQHAPLVAPPRDALRVPRYVQPHAADSPALAGSARAEAPPRSTTASRSSGGRAWRISAGPRRARPARRRAPCCSRTSEAIDLARSPLWLGHEHEVF